MRIDTTLASVLTGNDVAERTVESLKQGFVPTLLQLVATRLISNQISSSAWTSRTGMMRWGLRMPLRLVRAASQLLVRANEPT